MPIIVSNMAENRRPENLVSKVSSRNIFLLDGLGALLAALGAFTIATWFRIHVGIPSSCLYFLTILACIYSIYSFFCYFARLIIRRIFLKALIFANSVHVLLMLGMLNYFSQQLTFIGLVYFSLELVVMLGLIWLEILVFKKS